MSNELDLYLKKFIKLDNNAKDYFILKALYKQITIGNCTIEKPLPKVRKPSGCLQICYPGGLIINFDEVIIWEKWKKLEDISRNELIDKFIKLMKKNI